MSEKFQNTFHVFSARMPNWDYSNNGMFFITIYTKKRESFFGQIENREMIQNDSGILAEKNWLSIPDHFPFIELKNFIVMPNHIHGILVLNNELAIDPVETRLIASLQSLDERLLQGGFAGIKNPMLNNSISRIIRWYKGRCSYEIRKIEPLFEW